MMRLFDFKCPDGHVSERLVKEEVHSVRCDCGLQAARIVSPVAFHLNGSDASWPTAHSKWVKEHETAGKG